MPSPKILEDKKKVVAGLSETIKGAKSVVFTDYRGLTVEEDTEMRKALREASVDYKVVKNSMTSFAIKENGYDSFDEVLKGPTAMATCTEDPVISVKVLNDYSKKFKKTAFKGGIIEGKVVNVDELVSIAALPSKEELIAKVVGGISGPLYGLVYVLNANLSSLAIALNAIAEKKKAEEA